jgi:hypothetical protein
MNIHLAKAEFEQLPYREDVAQPVYGNSYRSRSWSKNMFVFRGDTHKWKWDCFLVVDTGED